MKQWYWSHKFLFVCKNRSNVGKLDKEKCLCSLRSYRERQPRGKENSRRVNHFVELSRGELVAQGETVALKCLLLTFPRWGQGERGGPPCRESCQKSHKGMFIGEYQQLKATDLKCFCWDFENYVYERTLLLVCSSAKQFSKWDALILIVTY